MAFPALKPAKRRRSIRHTARESGTIYDGSVYISCRVECISADGARLRISNDATIPPGFLLMIPSIKLKRSCGVAWRDGDRIGVQFV
jgi:PilZ domain